MIAQMLYKDGIQTVIATAFSLMIPPGCEASFFGRYEMREADSAP